MVVLRGIEDIDDGDGDKSGVLQHLDSNPPPTSVLNVSSVDYSLEKDLANLPEHLLLLIFRRVPIWAVVRTAILSKNWRDKWKKTSEVVFYDSETAPCRRSHFLDEFILSWLHNPPSLPITRFALNNFIDSDCYMMDELVIRLAEHGLQNLLVILRQPRVLSVLHMLRNLKYLILENLSLSILVPVHFHNLTYITLTRVSIPSQMLTSFLAGCPVLMHLTLTECIGDHFVAIRAPNLLTFHYMWGDCKVISVIESPQLEVASVCLRPRLPGTRSDLRVVLSGLQNLRRFYCFKGFTEILSEANSVNLLEFPPHLKKLTYFYMVLNLGDQQESEFAHFFFSRATSLESLDIKSITDVDSEDRFWGVVPACHYLPLLQSFRASTFLASEAEFKFLAYVIQNASKLQMLIIEWHPRVDEDSRIQLVERIGTLCIGRRLHLIV